MKPSPRDRFASFLMIVGSYLLAVIAVIFFMSLLLIETIGNSRWWQSVQRWWTGGRP